MSYGNMLACSRTYFCRRWESMMLSVIKLTIDAFGANLIFVQCVSLLIYVRIGKSCVTHSTIYEWYQRICKPMSQQNMVETSCGGKNPALCLSQAIFTSLTLITQKRLIFSSYQWSVVSRFCLPILILDAWPWEKISFKFQVFKSCSSEMSFATLSFTSKNCFVNRHSIANDNIAHFFMTIETRLKIYSLVQK